MPHQASNSVSAGLRALLRNPQFRRGVTDMYAFAPGIAAWGLVTGVAMVQSGLRLWLSLRMSATVLAGTAQLASLPLLAAGRADVGGLCVGPLRQPALHHLQAQWRVHIGPLARARRVALSYFLADLNLLVFQKAWPDGGREEAQVPYFLGGATWGLGFAGTIPTLGLAYGLLAGRTTRVAAMVAASAAIAAYALPLTLNIVVAIAAAVASSCG